MNRKWAKIVVLFVCLRGLIKWRQDSSEHSTVWTLRADVFRNSYDEVLAAVKHQDDKLGRVLTALAFLTAAGVALYTEVASRVLVTFGVAPLPVPTFFFLVFVGSVVLALAFTMSAIGPSTPYRKKAEKGKEPGSLLFFASIYDDPMWDEYIDWSPMELRKRLAENLHSEARTIARRTRYKIARSREANAFVYLAVIALSMMGIFSVGALSESTRWWISAVALFLFTVMPIWDLFHMKQYKFPEGEPSAWSYWLLAAAGLWTGVMLATALSRESQWTATVYALFTILVSRLSLVSRSFANVLLPVVAVGGLVILIIDK